MSRLKLPTLILAMGMLLLPPRWCCALPGSGAACCLACAPKLEAARSCCACSKDCGTKQAAKAAPSKCVCHFGQMRKESGVPGDVLSGAGVALATLRSVPLNSRGGLTADAPSVPCDVQSRLCRWQI